MYLPPTSIDSLIEEAEEQDLYFKLIEQTNKDFALANENIDIPLDIFPFELKLLIQEKIIKLINYKFAEYLNLLYIIDVSEDQIKKLNGSDVFKLSEDVTFLILKREWQKVWFRNKYLFIPALSLKLLYSTILFLLYQIMLISFVGCLFHQKMIRFQKRVAQINCLLLYFYFLL